MNEQGSSPGEAIRGLLDQRGWTQADLAGVIGKTTAAVNEIIQGKRGISPEMAALLANAFDTTIEFWLKLESSRVSEQVLDATKRRSHLYSIAPIREMVRRGWINNTTSLPELEEELKGFFGVETLNETLQFLL